MTSKKDPSTQDTAHGKFVKTKASDTRRSGPIILPVGQENVFVVATKKKEGQEKK
ncbi:MAG TPA: hypothetical protein VGB73_16570 [Pyrinomonadaceae bacterium]|jgi:hypothetical protein